MSNDVQKAVAAPASTTSEPEAPATTVSPTAQQAAGALAMQRIAGGPASATGKQPGGTQKLQKFLHGVELVIGTGTGPTIDGVGVAAGGQTAPQPVAAPSTSAKKKPSGAPATDPNAVDPTKLPPETLRDFSTGGLSGSLTKQQSGSGETDTLSVKDGKFGASAVGTETATPAGAFKATYAPTATTTLAAHTDGVGTAKQTETVEADYKKPGSNLSGDTKLTVDSTGVTAVADATLTGRGLTTTGTAGYDHGDADAAAGIKHVAPATGGLGYGVQGTANSKGQNLTADVNETLKGGHVKVDGNATLNAATGPTAGGSIDVTNKDKTEGFHVSVTTGPTGLNASVSATIKSVTFGVVMRNTSLVTVTLDLGPKHPLLNEIIRDALTVASAVAQPVPFGIGAGVRLFGALFKKKKKPTTAAAQAQATPATVPGASEPVAIILPEDFAGLQASGALTPAGNVDAELDPDKFAAILSGAGLDASQQAGLTSAYATAHVPAPTGPEAGASGDDEHAPA